MSATATNVMHGTTAECLKHFSAAAGINYTGSHTPKSVYPVRNGISDLLGISWSTGYAWFGHQQIPSGQRLLQLRFLLKLFGYDTTEQTLLEKNPRMLADLLGSGTLSLEEVARRMGVRNNSVLRWTIGGRVERTQPVGNDAVVLEQLLAEYAGALATRTQEWRQALTDIGLNMLLSKTEPKHRVVHDPPPVFQATSSDPATNSTLDHDQTIEVLAHLIRAAEPLACFLLSDTCTPEDRERLRSLTRRGASNGVFDLSNLLNRLCGERARRDITTLVRQV